MISSMASTRNYTKSRFDFNSDRTKISFLSKGTSLDTQHCRQCLPTHATRTQRPERHLRNSTSAQAQHPLRVAEEGSIVDRVRRNLHQPDRIRQQRSFPLHEGHRP